MENILEIENLNQWQEFKQNKAEQKEIIIFKYSPTCPVSYSIESMFDRWCGGIPEEANVTCAKINVVSARPVSQYIAKEFDIRHESPQLIWLSAEDEIKWQGSHYGITEKVLSENLNQTNK